MLGSTDANFIEAKDEANNKNKYRKDDLRVSNYCFLMLLYLTN